MAKVRLLSEFENAIVSDFNWRIREISDVRLILKNSSGRVLNAALRASVPLLYAHWEGHVAIVSKRYVDFIARRKFKYAHLARSYALADLFHAFKRMSESRPTITEQVDLIEKIAAADDRQFRSPEYDIVSSRSNLNSDILRGICRYLAFDFAPFDQEQDFIDKVLIHRRNSIAHGEYLSVDAAEFEAMSTRVIGLMRTFRNSASNMAYTESYRRA